MKEKKGKAAKQAAEGVMISKGKAERAYALLDSRSVDVRKGENETELRKGMKLTELKTEDMFKVVGAMYALGKVVDELKDFRKHARETLKPEGWDDLLEKARQGYDDMTEAEKNELARMDADYSRKVTECVAGELDKETETVAYERLDREAFGLLVKSNGMLDASDVALLMEVLV